MSVRSSGPPAPEQFQEQGAALFRPELRPIREIERRLVLRRGAAVAGGALALLLAGCVHLPGRGSAPTLYHLSPGDRVSGGPGVSWQLEVAEPAAGGGLATRHIALEPSPLRLEYFAGARWVERMPEMVRSLLLRSFEQSGRVQASGRGPGEFAADFVLKSEIVAFAAVYGAGGGAPVVHVRLDASLIARGSGRIVAARSFAVRIPATADRMPPIVAAFNRALGQVLNQIVPWTLKEGEAAEAAHTGRT